MSKIVALLLLVTVCITYGCSSNKAKEDTIEKEPEKVESKVETDLYTNKSVVNITLKSKGYSGRDALATIIDSKLIDFTKEQLEDVKVKTKFQDDTRRSIPINYNINGLEFNKSYSDNFKDVNTLLYCAVNKYLNSNVFSDLECSKYVNALYGMAISNVEFGEYNSPNYLLAPAVPTSKGIVVNKDNVLTFGYSDYLKYPSLLSIDRDGYRGVLQMYAGGYTDSICPEDLVGSEYTRLLNSDDSVAKSSEMNSLQYVEGSGVSSRLDGMTLENKSSNYGDRFNYVDAINRFSGTLHNLWKMYYGTAGITKDGEYAIDNMYSWMAMSAIGHNSSPGVFYIADGKNLSSSYFWWPYKSFGEVRMYAHYLGGKECTEYIQDMAYKSVEDSRKGGQLKFTLDRKEGCNVANYLVSKGYIPSGMWSLESSSREEKVAYPVQVLYNYFVLEAIYSGK